MFLINTTSSHNGRIPLKSLLLQFFLVLFEILGNKVQVICTDDFPSKLCYNNSVSCSHQVALANVSQKACQMIYHPRDSEVCSDSSFGGPPDLQEEYGKVWLTAYIAGKNQLDVAFNVTFSNIRWKRLLMRFKDSRTDEPMLCREFLVEAEVRQNLTLFFDCLWHNNNTPYGDYAGREIQFYYLFTTPTGETYVNNYLFRVPDFNHMRNSTALEHRSLFLVVDMSGLPTRIFLRVQELPRRLHVAKYYIALHRTMENNSWVVKTWILDVNTGKGVEEVDGKRMLTVQYETKSRHGIYHFEARPIHPDGKTKCLTSITPEFPIVEIPRLIELLCIVGSVILTPILLVIYYIWRNNWPPDTPAEPEGPPKILLIYKPVSVQHIRIMIELAKYLRSTCRLYTMLDQIGIPESDHKDPAKWYIEAFNEAHFVAIFASPNATPSEMEDATKFSKYLQLYEIATDRLKEKLCSPGTRCKFFCVSLPETHWNTLPVEAQALKRIGPCDLYPPFCKMLWKSPCFSRRYILPRDLDPLLVLVGVAPQCDHGVGFNAALAKAKIEEEIKAEPAEKEEPPTPRSSPVQLEPTPPPTPPQQVSCCTMSISDDELVTPSLSQPYHSDTSSLDESSLLPDQAIL